jgi:hypothetical protein
MLPLFNQCFYRAGIPFREEAGAVTSFHNCLDIKWWLYVDKGRNSEAAQSKPKQDELDFFASSWPAAERRKRKCRDGNHCKGKVST